MISATENSNSLSTSHFVLSFSKRVDFWGAKHWQKSTQTQSSSPRRFALIGRRLFIALVFGHDRSHYQRGRHRYFSHCAKWYRVTHRWYGCRNNGCQSAPPPKYRRCTTLAKPQDYPRYELVEELSDQDIDLIKEVLTESQRANLQAPMYHLQTQLQKRLHIAPDALNAEAFLQALIKDYNRIYG